MPALAPTHLEHPTVMNLQERRLRGRAQDRLASVPPETAKRIRSFRGFLDNESVHLRRRHEFGLGGREIARGRSDVVDVVVTRACRMVAEDLGPSARSELGRCAVVALGGYGRRELSPLSDVDILFLHPERRTPVMTEFVEFLLPLLWDVGLEVGHSVRSVSDCVRMGRSDLHARNAMSEARLLTGSPEIFDKLESDMATRVYGHTRANRFFKEAMQAEVRGRRGKYGPVAGMQEPHLKEGAGGLRDLHLVGWVGLARYGALQLEGLMEAGVLQRSELARALRAYDFLLRVRNEAHFQTGRRTDLIGLELQPQLAESLGYSDQRAAAASEIFMRDLYLRAQEVLRFTDAFLLEADFWADEEGFLGLRGRPRAVAVGPGRRYRLRDGVLEPAPEGFDPRGDGLKLLEVFEVAQDHGATVGDALLEEVRAHLDLVDRKLRQSPEAAERFLRMLGRTGRVAPTLRAMHEAGFLARYMPEFRRVTLLVQHDHYHRYTIDEHTLRTLEALDDLAGDEVRKGALVPLGEALDAVQDRSRLALALLLHDIGKGQGGDHVTKGAAMAKRICKRLHLSDDVTADVVFLVNKHLVMSRVSQRRDLMDPAVIRGFAETVETEDRLRMLFVLTHSDITGVGPGTWNDWKAALLCDLYDRALHALRGLQPRHLAEDGALAERVLEALGHPEILRSDVEEFLSHLPDRYPRLVPPEVIADHLQMVRTLASRNVLTDWRASDRGPYTVVSVCVADARGVLGKVAGALTGAGLDILSVDVFTRDDGVALDVFRVSDAMAAGPVHPVPEDRYPEITGEIEAALAGARDPAEAVERQRARQARRRRRRPPAPPAVRFVEPDPSGRTVVEVRADDQPGVVYRIATTLARLGLDIGLAKISTEKNQALDVFYVTDGGEPLASTRHEEVRAALLEALEA